MVTFGNMRENQTRRFSDPALYVRRERDKNRPGRKRKYKLNKRLRPPISYKRRFRYRSSKLNTGRTKYIFLFRYKLLIRFFADKTDLSPNQFEFLVSCYSYDYFLIQDILDVTFTPQSFVKKEWAHLLHENYVQLYKSQRRADGLGNLYRLSFRGNRLIADFYAMLLGEKELPAYSE